MDVATAPVAGGRTLRVRSGAGAKTRTCSSHGSAP